MIRSAEAANRSLAGSLAGSQVEDQEWLSTLAPDQQERLVNVLDHYLIEVEEGRPVDTDELLKANPEIAEPLRHYLRGLALVRAVAQPTAQEGEPGSTLNLWTPKKSTANASQALSTSSEGDRRSSDGQSEKPRFLGTYELGPVIGQGAMGVVYQARDTKLDREVALKVLAYGTALEQTRIDRFRLEAKTAASLDHPNVVRVYDVGCEGGTHYYAMQLIEGESLDRRLAASRISESMNAAEQRKNASIKRSAAPLAGADRYRRIAQWGASAASALYAAHTAGVIHRDVKPSNLLLGHDGQLWVTDFGLARVQSEMGLTRTGELVGTLRYMSPEQARGHGDLIDARTDVYGLGATLYELVAGAPAFSGDDAVALLRDIQFKEPAALRTTDPEVPRDLETIIQRAMRPRPGERYNTAAALADDLQRFLEGKSIHANSISWFERALAWARHHRHLASSLLFMWVLLLLASFATTYYVAQAQSNTVNALRDSKAHYRDARRAVDTLGADVARRLSTIPEAASVRQDVLAKTMRYYEQFIERSGSDPSLVLEVGSTRLEMARLVGLTGTYTDTESAYRHAVDALDSVLQHESTLNSQQIVESLRLGARALNEWALAASQHGYQNRAIRLLHQAQDRLAQLDLRSIAESTSTQLDKTLTHNNLGVVFLRNGAPAQSRIEFEQAITTLQQLPDQALADGSLNSELADALSNMSALLSETGQYPEAAAAARQSLRLRTFVEDSQDAEALSRMAITHNNLAALQWKAGQADQAILAYRKAVDLLERAIRRAPAHAMPRDRLAVTLNNLGMALVSADSLPEAEKVLKRAASIAEPGWHADPSDTEAARRLGGIYNNLGVLLRNQGRLDEANELLNQAVQLMQASSRHVPETSRKKAELEQVQSNLESLGAS